MTSRIRVIPEDAEKTKAGRQTLIIEVGISYKGMSCHRLARNTDRYKGISIGSVLDRFLTAARLSHDNKGRLIRAAVYGDGVDILKREQGDVVDILD